MSSRTQARPERSQRDELEQLQEELRQVRRQREPLPAEIAELASQVVRMEEEVHELGEALEAIRQRQRASRRSSLPELLAPPFVAREHQQPPSLVLRVIIVGLLIPAAGVGVDAIGSSIGLGLLILAAFLVMGLCAPSVFQRAFATVWRFDEEGFHKELFEGEDPRCCIETW